MHDILDKIRRLVDHEPSERLARGLFTLLDVLDAKARGLLGINTILITILAGFLVWSLDHDQEHLVQVYGNVPAADLGLIWLSSILCLWVTQISWSFYKFAVRRPDGSYDFEPEFVQLAVMVRLRTHCYLLAWWMTLLGLLIPAAWPAWRLLCGCH